MPTADDTIRAMEVNLMRMQRYQDWTIRCTSDPEHLEAELDYPPFFRFWQTDSIEDAKTVQRHFVAKGMQSEDDAGRTPLYVALY